MGYASAMAWVLLLVIAAVTALLFRTSRLVGLLRGGAMSAVEVHETRR